MHSIGGQKKELKEQLKHGTNVFPLASYFWQGMHIDHRVSLHWHPEVEIVRFVDGRFTYALNAEQSCALNGAGILIIPGNILHTMLLPRGSHEEALVFSLSMLSFEHYDELQSDIFDALQSGNMPLPRIITPDSPCFARADELLSFLIAHAKDSGAAQRLLIKARLLELLSLCYEHGFIVRRELKSSVLEKSRQDRLKELLTYIDAHYAGPMTVGDAASRLKVSVQYFCRYFKKVTGMSFTEYLNDLRLRRAAQAIVESSEPIAGIASMHGFDNTGYFFKNFKAKFGTTPLKYRKHHQEQSSQALT